MVRKLSSFILVAAVLVSVYYAQAQQPAKIPRIGFLSPGFGAVPKPFQHRLEELGYVQGKNIVIEYRSAEGKLDRLPNLAGELVRLNVHLIVAAATPAAQAAKHATTTIPIVMVESAIQWRLGSSPTWPDRMEISRAWLLSHLSLAENVLSYSKS